MTEYERMDNQVKEVFDMVLGFIGINDIDLELGEHSVDPDTVKKYITSHEPGDSNTFYLATYLMEYKFENNGSLDIQWKDYGNL